MKINFGQKEIIIKSNKYHNNNSNIMFNINKIKDVEVSFTNITKEKIKLLI